MSDEQEGAHGVCQALGRHFHMSLFNPQKEDLRRCVV